MLVSVFILGVPYRGSLLILFFISSLFLLSTRDGAADFHDYPQPVQCRSGRPERRFSAVDYAFRLYFQIDSMPAVIRAVTYIIPARYFVSTLQSLFLAGNIPVVLVVNVLFLIASAVMFIGLTWLKTKRRLD